MKLGTMAAAGFLVISGLFVLYAIGAKDGIGVDWASSPTRTSSAYVPQAGGDCDSWTYPTVFVCSYPLVVRNNASQTVDLKVTVGHVFINGTQTECNARACYDLMDSWRLAPSQHLDPLTVSCNPTRSWTTLHHRETRGADYNESSNQPQNVTWEPLPPGNGTGTYVSIYAQVFVPGATTAASTRTLTDSQRTCDALPKDWTYTLTVLPNLDVVLSSR